MLETLASLDVVGNRPNHHQREGIWPCLDRNMVGEKSVAERGLCPCLKLQ
jgi:hypothetical protein